MGSDLTQKLIEAIDDLDANLVSKLIREGANPNALDDDGATMLTWAIDAESDRAHQYEEPLTVDITALLLAAGASPWKVPGDDDPLDFAIHRRHPLAAQLIREARLDRPGPH